MATAEEDEIPSDVTAPTAEELEEARRVVPFLRLIRDGAVVALLARRGSPVARLLSLAVSKKGYYARINPMKEVLDTLKLDEIVLDSDAAIVEVVARGSKHSEERLHLRRVETRERDVLDWLLTLQQSIVHALEQDFQETWKTHRLDDATPLSIHSTQPLQTLFLLRRVQLAKAIDELLDERAASASVSAGLVSRRGKVLKELETLVTQVAGDLNDPQRGRAEIIITFLSNQVTMLNELVRFASPGIAREELTTYWGRMLRHVVTPDRRVVARCNGASTRSLLEVPQRFSFVKYCAGLVVNTPLSFSLQWTFFAQIAK